MAKAIIEIVEHENSVTFQLSFDPPLKRGEEPPQVALLASHLVQTGAQMIQPGEITPDQVTFEHPSEA